ncbi:MAG: isoprenyl transferase [Bacteroidales bacterium]
MEKSLKDKIDPKKLPAHIAIIMDGNGRWAKRQGKPRIFGHHQGVVSVRKITEAAAQVGVKYLTLYAFSTENWNRPRTEVNALMQLLVQTLHKETRTLHDNEIRLEAIGEVDQLPEVTRRELKNAIRDTAHYNKMTLVLALSYSGRWELTHAFRQMAGDIVKGKLNADAVDQEKIESYLQTAGKPDPELLIRTSGEYRISNFLLWQIAYSELYFSKKYWPEFREEDLYEAIIDYQHRERRFGKISEQIR